MEDARDLGVDRHSFPAELHRSPSGHILGLLLIKTKTLRLRKPFRAQSQPPQLKGDVFLKLGAGVCGCRIGTVGPVGCFQSL